MLRVLHAFLLLSCVSIFGNPLGHVNGIVTRRHNAYLKSLCCKPTKPYRGIVQSRVLKLLAPATSGRPRTIAVPGTAQDPRRKIRD